MFTRGGNSGIQNDLATSTEHDRAILNCPTLSPINPALFNLPEPMDIVGIYASLDFDLNACLLLLLNSFSE